MAVIEVERHTWGRGECYPFVDDCEECLLEAWERQTTGGVQIEPEAFPPEPMAHGLWTVMHPYWVFLPVESLVTR